MRKGRGTRLGVGLLLGAVCALSFIDYQLLQSEIDISPIAPALGRTDASRLDSAEPATALDKRTAQQFRQIVDRPLFNPNRKPVQRKETAAAQPTTERLGKLRLIGVMISREQPPRALFRFADEPTGTWVAEGADFNGWTLRKVNKRSVIVEAGTRSQELTLFTPSPAPADEAKQ